MPEATEYTLESLDKKLYESIEETYQEEFNNRLATIKRNWNYYNGNHDLPLKIQKDGYDDNVIVNHVEALSDRITSFLIGDGISFDPEDVWLGDDLLIESMAISSIIEGHGILRIAMEDPIRLIRVKGSHFSAFWNPFDLQDIIWYRLQHVTNGIGKRIDYVKGSFNGREIDRDQEVWTEFVFSSKKENVWELEEDNLWPFSWPPIIDWQNLPNVNGYYGKSDIKGAIDLNDALNFILSNSQRIVKHFAAPKTVITGAIAQDVQETQVGGLFSIGKPDANVFNLELQSDGNFVQWLTSIISRGLWSSGGMVDPDVIKDQIGQLTNFGLRVLFANAIKRTQKKRILFEEALLKTITRSLELMNISVDDISVIWPDILPEDDRTVSDILLQELSAGIISKETYRMIRGYNEELELERIESEASQRNIGSNILDLISNNGPFNRGL